MTTDECPVPFPGIEFAELRPNGWETIGVSTVPWPDSDQGSDWGCSARAPWYESWQCTRDKDHSSRWHIAEIRMGEVVAVWTEVADDDVTGTRD